MQLMVQQVKPTHNRASQGQGLTDLAGEDTMNDF